MRDLYREGLYLIASKVIIININRRIADLYATNSQAFVNIMMLEELGLVVDDSNPLWNGIVTFISFVVFGFLPLIPYIIGYGIKKDD